MNYYNQIKEELINNEVYKKVKDYSKNRSDLSTYYNVGKLLVEAQGGEERAKYGDGLIKEYSKKLTLELGKKFNLTLLKNIRQFYLIVQKGPTLSDQLSWSHYVELLKFDDIKKINYYIHISINQKLAVRELRFKIKNNEYERLPKDTKNKLKIKEENKINDFIKNPILIKNSYNYIKITEKVLKQLILEDLPNFLSELGEGFCFIKDEYKIKIGERYNYIDLLLFNIKYNCYVVVELKITELKKEHIGQIQTYMNYIDKHIKTINQDKTIGIIICKKGNEFVMEYCSDDRIFNTIYNLTY
ncbi:MAG: DUF1016 domain-containing protein [Firmicutes bacterium]|nr:DUF1016 domain-containing protein [Bacillota bacterium]